MLPDSFMTAATLFARHRRRPLVLLCRDDYEDSVPSSFRRQVARLYWQALVWLMRRPPYIFTDSGGIQEEAPSLGKPVLIMRDTTERAEVVEAGCARLDGTKAEEILAAACELLENLQVYQATARVKNPFDGHASERIAELLATG